MDTTIIINLQYDYSQVCMMVERETSEVARRQTDKDGNSLFEILVMDEQYDDLRAAYMRRAGATLEDVFAPYIQHPMAQYYDKVVDRNNLQFCLHVPPTFMESAVSGIDANVYDYIVSYMCREWYWTKNTDIAQLYKAKEDGALMNIKHLLNKRKRPITRPYHII